MVKRVVEVGLCMPFFFEELRCLKWEKVRERGGCALQLCHFWWGGLT